MRVEKHIRDAAEKWVQDESIAKDTYEVDRAFRAGAKYILDKMSQANGVNAETKATELYKLLAAGDSAKAEEFRIHLTEPDELKIVATGVGFDNIRIEPVSANCIIVHACS